MGTRHHGSVFPPTVPFQAWPFYTLILAGVLIGTPAHAQVCADATEVRKTLEERYGERPFWRGPTDAGAVFELLQSHPSGSWTLLVVHPNGVACLMASGEGAELVKPKVRGRGA